MNWQVQHLKLSLVIMVCSFIAIHILSLIWPALMWLGLLESVWTFLLIIAGVRALLHPIVSALDWSFRNSPAPGQSKRRLLPDASDEQTDAAIAESLALLDELEAEECQR